MAWSIVKIGWVHSVSSYSSTHFVFYDLKRGLAGDTNLYALFQPREC